MERARRLVLEHCCGEHAHEWELVWTSGATAALRAAAEAFPFSAGRSAFAHIASAHTSVLGMRASAAAAGATCHCLSLEALLDAAVAADAAVGLPSTFPLPAGDDAPSSYVDHLIVLPAECNLTGDRLPIGPLFDALSTSAPAACGAPIPRGGRWWLLLDAAKAASTTPLDLHRTGASMACISLYKLFGEPTGIGALLVRSDLARHLRRDGGYYGGGSVAAVLASDQTYRVPRPSIATALSPGTPHYRGALAVPAGFAALARLGGMGPIHAHTMSLASELARRLRALVHANGQHAVLLYGARSRECATDADEHEHRRYSSEGASSDDLAGGGVRVRAGPVVAFNVVRANGEVVGYAEVLKLAALHAPPIQLRGGCCCNPGGCQLLLGLSDAQIREAAASGKQCGDELDSFDGHPTGVVRASVGRDSIWEDIDSLSTFVEATFVASASTMPAAPPALEPLVPSSARLSAIYVYPLKSCAAMRVPAWWAEAASGRLAYDREWAVVDGCGVVMRLSAHPSLALIRPAIDVAANTLTLACERMRTPLVLPLAEESSFKAGPSCDETHPTARRVNVCGNDCDAHEWGGAASSCWLSEALGMQCRLVRHAHSLQGSGCLGEEGASPPKSGVAFANEAPLLLVTQSAIDALNVALRASGEPPVSAQHFRPNLLVEGVGDLGLMSPKLQMEPPGTGTVMRRLEVGSGALGLRVLGPCARCAMVEIDPTSGARHGAVLRALAKHHRVRSRLLFGYFCELDSHEAGPHESRQAKRVEMREDDAVEVILKYSDE